MIVGIVCAVETELQPFLDHMSPVETVDRAMLRSTAASSTAPKSSHSFAVSRR